MACNVRLARLQRLTPHIRSHTSFPLQMPLYAGVWSFIKFSRDGEEARRAGAAPKPPKPQKPVKRADDVRKPPPPTR